MDFRTNCRCRASCITLFGQHFQPSMDEPGSFASPVCGQLNRENVFFPVHVRSRLRIWSREKSFGCPVPR